MSGDGDAVTLYALTSHALPADALCGLDESECGSVDKIARAIEASGYGEATAHRAAILRAIGEHLRAYTDACEALRWLTTIDRRLAVWGACVCAREALRFVAEGEERPLRAVETAERWLAGLATIEEARAASAAAYAASAAAYAASAAAANSAATAAAAAAANSAATAAANSAERAGYYGVGWPAIRTAELTRLVGVVADALPGLPPETT